MLSSLFVMGFRSKQVSFMFLNQFFTEYDETISQSLNIDPLGMTMIWSGLGQAIFHNRVSSISNDVRNYTLNLVHHFVIKQLVERNGARLSSELEKVYGQIDSLAFKQTCLIFLENVFVFSMLEAETQSHDVQTQGILGASKARLKMSKGLEPLQFSKQTSAQLLVRQLTLGVSGRYKTPFIDMAFFDREYRYNLPSSALQWVKAKSLIQTHNELGELVTKLLQLLNAVITQNHQVPLTPWQAISHEIKQGYAKCFSSSEVVGQYSKKFWLEVTELDQKAAGSLYKAIDSKAVIEPSVQGYFEHALTLENDELEKQKLKHICQVEPFLAECELLFSLLMNKKIQTEKEVYDAYLGLKRRVNSVIVLARALTHVGVPLSGTAGRRYNALLALGQLDDTERPENMAVLMDKLLQYHRGIMAQRGQSPWVEKDRQGHYRCGTKLRDLPTAEQRPYKSWYHGYYFDQFSQLIRGLEGERHV